MTQFDGKAYYMQFSKVVFFNFGAFPKYSM
jgi:hypothetical protein